MASNDDQCIDEPDTSSSDPIDRMALCDLRPYAKRLRQENSEAQGWIRAYRETVEDMAATHAATYAELKVTTRVNREIREDLARARDDVMMMGVEIAKLKEHVRNGTSPLGGVK